MNDGILKVRQFFSSRTGRVTIVSFLSLVIGFGINILIQRSSNIGASAIIKELLLSATTPEEALQLPEKIEKVIGTIYSPFSVQSFIYTFLFAFLGLSLSNMLFPLDKKDESETVNEDIIVNLLEHLIEDCYNRCSNTDCIDGCPKLASECDGLLKRYLYEETQQLKLSITRSKKGEYALDTNIERFHTIAIDHLIAARSRQYAVVQWIGSKPYSNNNKYQETYDRMDFHFLNVLLERLTTTNKKIKQPYYKPRLPQRIMFKIKWLLIGDINCMQNNFDYIFHVIKSRRLETVVKEFFEFYLISETAYRTVIDPILAISDSTCKRLMNIDSKPSFGVFGENFMFADSPEPDHHGTIYTRTFIPDNGQHDIITSVNQYFDKLTSDGNTVRQDFDSLMNQYNEILRNDSSWEGNLKTIWHPETQ